MFQILALSFILIPAFEIYLLFKFAGFFGAFNTFLLVIVTGVVGAALAKREGLSILNKIQSELHANRLPANEMISGLLVFGGGLLLLTPGFFTDFLGLSMIFPVSRLFYIALFKDLFKRGVLKGNIQVFSSGSFKSERPQYQQPGEVDDVIEAEYSKK